MVVLHRPLKQRFRAVEELLCRLEVFDLRQKFGEEGFVAEIVAEKLETEVAGVLECLERGLGHVCHIEFFANAFVHETIP